MTETGRGDMLPTSPAGGAGVLPTAPTSEPAAPRSGVEASVRWWTGEGSVPHKEAARACRRRALLLWPRLDASRLARTTGDPWRIARLVAARTPRSLDEIVAMLTRGTPACPVVPARSHRSVPMAARTAPRR